MPFWTRKPIGTYLRSTPDWFLHQRARAAVQTEGVTADYVAAFGLFNNSSPAAYLHVLSVSLFFTDSPPPTDVSLYAHYIGGPIAPNPDGDAFQSATTALYADDPLPPGVALFGQATNPTDEESTILAWDGLVFNWSPGYEIAVIPPNYSWEFYMPTGEFAVDYVFMCDYLWLPD